MVAAITTPTAVGAMIITILVVIVLTSVMFLVKRWSQRKTKSVQPPLSYSNYGEQCFNNSLNDSIARELELGAYEDHDE